MSSGKSPCLKFSLENPSGKISSQWNILPRGIVVRLLNYTEQYVFLNILFVRLRGKSGMDGASCPLIFWSLRKGTRAF